MDKKFLYKACLPFLSLEDFSSKPKVQHAA